VASALSLTSVASASAQALRPGVPVEQLDTISVPKLPARALTLEQARAAIQAAVGEQKTLTGEASAALAGNSITAVFLAPAQILAVVGTAQDDTIVVTRNAAGRILVNGGAVPVLGGTPTVANTTLVESFGLAGNDALTLSEVNGALPPALLFGGAGNDVLTGGSGNDQLFGEAGNDSLLGKGGVDALFGGADSDTLTGGVGDDQSFGDAGNDRIIWNPGEGSDLNEGGDGTDSIEVNGGNGAETFTVVPNGSRVRFDRVTPAPFFLDIGTSESLVVNMNGGDDTFSAINGLATLIQLTVDGGTGNDTIGGGDGDDFLLGGEGNDTIDGNRGNDTALLGAGDDVFVWDPGDGNDLVEGQAGADTMRFNGSNVAESFDFSANGARLRFARNVGTIVMDTAGVERVELNALGGADVTTVNDLSGTDVSAVALSLAATGGTTGDGANDTVIVNATAGADFVSVTGTPGLVSVDGLVPAITITSAESTDSLIVNGLPGDDVLTAQPTAAGVISVTLDGGDGADVLLGGDGNDTLLGGPGDDVLLGGPGQDVLDGGTGDNTLIQ
jgi:Ca2+-binding RTX toxin-like protein